MNVVFDLGGVLLEWNPDAIVARAFDDPALRAVAKREIMLHPDWLELDRGSMSFAVAIARAAERSGIEHAVVVDFFRTVTEGLVAKEETVDLLYRVRAAGNEVYCLSNMPGETFDYLERTHSFWDAFSGMVVSYRIGHCKPEPAIYEHLLSTFALVAEETVFIDDMPANLAAAETFGIRTIRFESAGQVESELRGLGALPR